MLDRPAAGGETESSGGRVKEYDLTKRVWKNTRLGAAHHRMIWWMIDAGAMKGVLGRGWITECSRQMGIGNQSVLNRIKLLVEVGCLKKVGGGKYRFQADFFESAVPDGSVKVDTK